MATMLAEQVAALRAEVDIQRREVGVYCMAYVRSILPPAGKPMWARLEQVTAAEQDSSKGSLWGALQGRLEDN